MTSTDASGKVSPAFAISLWIVMGYSMIIFNKIVLSTWGFNYPCFLTCWHCLLSTILTQILASCTNLMPAVQQKKITTSSYLKKIFPIAICFSFSLVLGNMAYQHISLGYIQMIKAVTPVPLLLLYFAFGREKASALQLSIVSFISLGVIISSVGELQFSWVGFLMQISAVCFDCFRLVTVDSLLKDNSMDSLSLLYYTAPLSFLLLCMGFVSFELPNFPFEIFTYQFCGVLLANGLLAFSLNLAAVFLISSCSGMVLSVSGPIKDICVIITSATVFGSPVTSIQTFGFSLTLFGLYYYQKYKRNPKEVEEEFTYCFSLIGSSPSKEILVDVHPLQSLPMHKEASSHKLGNNETPYSSSKDEP